MYDDSRPGPRGALPSGYCCTGDEQCRWRDCRDVAGARSCSDSCFDDDGCNATAGMRCVGATGNTPGHCEPVAPGACLPAAQFHYGADKVGACCTATHDGRAGLDCEGGLCWAFGGLSNPYICIHVCTKAADCPADYLCSFAEHFSVCVPLADPYTCS